MRKADYDLLARLIRTRVEYARTLAADPLFLSARREGAIRLDLLTGLGASFAVNAHVNKSEFLRACGIE